MIKVNIFTPVYYRFESTKKSLESVIKNLKASAYDCKLFIGVNGVENDEMKEWLKSLSSVKVKVFFSERNVGKAEIINYMYSIHNDCTHVISFDSDLIAESGNFIDEMVWAIEHFPEFGLLSTFLKENDCHIWNDLGGMPNTVSKENKEIRYGSYRCIAGCCVILKKQIWDTIKGYNTYGKVYGFDDALMMLAINNIGKKVGVVMDTKLIHPIDTDIGFREWKGKNIASRQEKGYYESR